MADSATVTQKQLAKLLECDLEKPILWLKKRPQRPDDKLKYVFFDWNGVEKRAKNTGMLACADCHLVLKGGGSAR